MLVRKGGGWATTYKKGGCQGLLVAAQFSFFFRHPFSDTRRPAKTMEQRCALTARRIHVKVGQSVRPGCLNVAFKDEPDP